MAYEQELTPANIVAAAQRLKGRVMHTPLELSEALSEASGTRAYLKLENLQRTGSFKIRGALNRLLTLSEPERARGIVAASAGNHALGVAEAAKLVGARATLIVPESGSPAKIAALRRYPAEHVELLVEGADYDAAEALAIALARDSQRRYVSAYNDPQVMAGQGTTGVEILEDLPDVEAILVPVGGGGLIAGIGLWAKTINPRIRVIGLQSTASPQMYAAFKAGHLITVPVLDSLADGLAGNIEPGSPMYDLARQYADEMVLVEESEIAEAMVWYLEQHHLIVEGSGAVALAALRHHRIEGLSGKKVA
ncbi:MAG TPA: threonine/serine dehydratase, partial [Ktedonobacterales bacterium]|nr:threonine/serine dehydratase [Ktedonobacterales bacterium]